MNLDAYRPAVFTVSQIRFVKGSYSTNRTYDKSWLEGTIEGRTEKFHRLGDYVKGTINSQKDMDSQFKAGMKLAVMFNPAMASHREERILYPDKDFGKTRRKTLDKMLHTAYYPLAVCLGLCFLFGIAAGKVKTAVGFFFGSMFLVIFSWAPTVYGLL